MWHCSKCGKELTEQDNCYHMKVPSFRSLKDLQYREDVYLCDVCAYKINALFEKMSELAKKIDFS